MPDLDEVPKRKMKADQTSAVRLYSCLPRKVDKSQREVALHFRNRAVEVEPRFVPARAGSVVISEV
jgi:hypothetical protein